MTEEHPYTWAVKHAPIGVWRTASGSAGMLMGSVLKLSVDGTGSVEHRLRMSQGEQRTLLWKCNTPGELQIYQVHEDHPFPDSEADWDVFCFRTDWRRFDVGSGPVLVNDVVNDGWLVKDGFWTLDSPIQLVSRT